MFHIIYKVTSSSGKYYIGRHSTEDINDGYLGSGKWVRSLKNKTILTKEILEYCESFSELLEKEKQYIQENINHPDCMNFNNSPIGFSTGELNPAKSEEERLKRSIRLSEDNPAKSEETRFKISKALKGKPSNMKGKKHTEESKKNISEGRIGIKYSEEGRKKLSESRKAQYDNGERTPPSFKGKKHDQETIDHLKQKAIERNKEKIICPHCGKSGSKAVMHRWHFDKCKHKDEE